VDNPERFPIPREERLADPMWSRALLALMLVALVGAVLIPLVLREGKPE
jgi:hypothetical protein